MMHESFRTSVECSGVINVGYRIVYGAEPVIQKKSSGTVRIRVLVALSFLAFAWTVRLLWPEGRAVLAMHLLPGDQTLAETAFLNLLEHLKHGERMVDSLTVFCREILHEII